MLRQELDDVDLRVSTDRGRYPRAGRSGARPDCDIARRPIRSERRSGIAVEWAESTVVGR